MAKIEKIRKLCGLGCLTSVEILSPQGCKEKWERESDREPGVKYVIILKSERKREEKE